MKKQLSKIFYIIFRRIFRKKILLLIEKTTPETQIDILKQRVSFFFKKSTNEIAIKKISAVNLIIYTFYPAIKLLHGFSDNKKAKYLLQKNYLFFDIDFNKNPKDGWNWHYALTKYHYSEMELKSLMDKSKNKLFNYKSSLALHEKCYVFGTGPSLEKARQIDWSDGYRVVCNTIVKDKEMWEHVNPHFIVAGDAIYHFGQNEFAQSFIKDLELRLFDSQTYFVYPYYYHAFIFNNTNIKKDNLIPIWVSNSEYIHNSIISDFSIPGKIGNVLNFLLLPLAAFLSKKILLWGFDGRAPDDKLFWSNSSAHSYSDKLKTIIRDHPKFFEHYVPKGKENLYVDQVFGEKLEYVLSKAENEGYDFSMLHQTWTPTLKKRMIENK